VNEYHWGFLGLLVYLTAPFVLPERQAGLVIVGLFVACLIFARPRTGP
jgi:hypothetical protein